MEERSEIQYAVLKSVLIAAVIFIVICLVWTAAVYLLDFNPPSSSGSVTTLVSTIVSANWFGYKVKRTMRRSERLRFAVGVTIVNAVVPVVFISALIVSIGLPLTAASFDLVLAGGKGYLFKPVLAWFMLVILVLVFAQAYFFGWLYTRKKGNPGPVAS